VHERGHMVPRTLARLRFDQTKMLAPELTAESCCKATGHIGLAVHPALDEVGILDDDSDLRVAIALLRTIVEVGRADLP